MAALFRRYPLDERLLGALKGLRNPSCFKTHRHPTQQVMFCIDIMYFMPRKLATTNSRRYGLFVVRNTNITPIKLSTVNIAFKLRLRLRNRKKAALLKRL
jgi:hypothetical protein